MIWIKIDFVQSLLKHVFQKITRDIGMHAQNMEPSLSSMIDKCDRGTIVNNEKRFHHYQKSIVFFSHLRWTRPGNQYSNQARYSIADGRVLDTRYCVLWNQTWQSLNYPNKADWKHGKNGVLQNLLTIEKIQEHFSLKYWNEIAVQYWSQLKSPKNRLKDT